jgi:hypothetical protein
VPWVAGISRRPGKQYQEAHNPGLSLVYLTLLIYAARGVLQLPSAMLFKTQSASVYGIDAYLVEVEIDVGSARTQDFNVVGLPDNAVKESRERIKSALRNCGFEFPHGQGVTINLAPADVRKEGSAFDLPMALGLVRVLFSARAHDRILKVARTIADLDAFENIDPRHLGEAFSTALSTAPTGPSHLAGYALPPLRRSNHTAFGFASLQSTSSAPLT